MPSQGYNKGTELLNALGSFWSRLFQQKDFIRGFTEGVELEFDQEYFRFLEIVLAKSIKDIPVFHREKWTLLTFKESAYQNSEDIGFFYDPEAPVYGPQVDPTEYEPDREYQYGNFFLNKIYGFELPTGMVDVSNYITNKLLQPSLVWSKNADFIIYKQKFIIFNKNPFEESKIPKRNIVDEEGEIVDREIAIWVLNSDHDYTYLYRNYGSVIGITGESSQEYKDLLRTIWAYFTRGATVEMVVSAANIILGYPVARDDETVEDIREISASRLMVTTDTNCYILPGAVSDTDFLHPTVAVGSRLTAFQPLLNIVEVKDTFNDKHWWRNLPFAIFPKQILGEDFLSALLVPNAVTCIDGKYGATAPLKMKADMTPALEELTQNYPLTYGMPVKYGPNEFDNLVLFPEVRLNELDWMMEAFFKNNIFFMKARLNQYHRLSEAGATAFFEGLPAHTFPMILFEYSLDPDVYPGDLCEHVYNEGPRQRVLAKRHPVREWYPIRNYRFLDGECGQLVHFTDDPDPVPDCLPSRNAKYFYGNQDYQDQLALGNIVGEGSYFYNSTGDQWYRWDTGTEAWVITTDCTGPNSVIGITDTALEVGYGPYLRGNPECFLEGALDPVTDCAGQPDVNLLEDPLLNVDGRHRTETVIPNAIGNASCAAVADGYFGLPAYGDINNLYGGPLIYGQASWICGVNVRRVHLNCPAS